MGTGARRARPPVALENGLHDLGPAPRVERLCVVVVDAAAAQPAPRTNTYGKFRAAFFGTLLILPHPCSVECCSHVGQAHALR